MGQVKAHDPDEGENGRITYSLVDFQPVFESTMFQIHTNGEITNILQLDHETKSAYYFRVKAEDSGSERKAKYTNVTINIININDESPKILLPQENLTVAIPPSEVANCKFFQLKAEDPDERSTDSTQSQTTALTYTILKGNENNIFFIDQNTGELFLSKSPVNNKYGMHTLEIAVNDTDNLHSTVAFVKVVIDQNAKTKCPSKLKAIYSGGPVPQGEPNIILFLLLLALAITVIFTLVIVLICIIMTRFSRKNSRNYWCWPCFRREANKNQYKNTNGCLETNMQNEELLLGKHQSRSSPSILRVESLNGSDCFINRDPIQYMGVSQYIEPARSGHNTLASIHSNHRSRSRLNSPCAVQIDFQNTPLMAVNQESLMMENSPVASKLLAGEEQPLATPPSESSASQQTDSGLNLSKVSSFFVSFN